LIKAQENARLEEQIVQVDKFIIRCSTMPLCGATVTQPNSILEYVP